MVWDQKSRERYAGKRKDPDKKREQSRLNSAARRAKIKAEDPNYLVKRRKYNAEYLAKKLIEDPDYLIKQKEYQKDYKKVRLKRDPLYQEKRNALARETRKKLAEAGGEEFEQHKAKANQITRDWFAKNKDDPEFRAKKRASERRRARLRVMGVSPEEFEARLEAQNHACGICHVEVKEGVGRVGNRACADHCHDDTKRFRGILCGRCNSGIGMFLDNPEFIKSALEWLTRVTPSVEAIVIPIEIGDPQKLYERRRSRRRRGLDHEEVRKHIILQENKCGICRVFVTDAPEDIRQKACADHCHREGALRGVLCVRCNTGLGLFKDSVSALTNAIEWVKQ